MFKKAGEDFDVTVTAHAWSAADDTNADGVPDSGANLTDNGITTQFGAEASAATVAIAPTLFAPPAASGATTGSLTGAAVLGGFAAGTATSQLQYSEVGIIDISATHANYLASGQSVTGTVAQVGRFIPARFSLSDNSPTFRNGPDASWTCAFTYLDQPFAFASDPVFTLTAVSVSGAPTLNYGSTYWRYSYAGYLSARSYTDTSGTAAPLDAPGLGTVALAGDTDFTDGAGTLTLSGERFAYGRSTAPVEPFVGSITMRLSGADLSDLDGVCYHSTDAQLQHQRCDDERRRGLRPDRSR